MSEKLPPVLLTEDGEAIACSRCFGKWARYRTKSERPVCKTCLRMLEKEARA